MKGSSEKINKEVHEYYKYLRLSNYQKSTVKMYCRTLEKFLLFYSDKYRGQQLCQDHAQETPARLVPDALATLCDLSCTHSYFDPYSLKNIYIFPQWKTSDTN